MKQLKTCQRLFGIFFIISLLTVPFVTMAQPPSEPDIDALFKDFNKPNVPGASVAIIQNGEIIFEKAYGLSDLELKTPATVSTNYRLASLSKQFTAMAAMILIERGKLSLDDRLTDLLPGFPNYGTGIRLRHLLGHLGGLKDYENLIPSGQTKQLSDEDVFQIYRRQTSGMFLPASQYHYSNGGFVMLGLVVEKAAKESFGAFLKREIFDRLGMDGSILMGSGQIQNRAFGYSPSGGGFVKTDQSSTSATRGDGCVYTSVHDWLKWERALEASQLVSPALQALSFTPGTLNNGAKTQYGFGWMLGSFNGMARQYHTGSTIGFRTAVERIPQKKFAVVVLANRANSEPWTIARKISELYNP